MFSPARWRSEKSKIKTVFKLQFHATRLAQLEGDSLMISVIPADVGKPTSRLDKAKVRDGSCYWEKPLYETVKFSLNPKTGKFNDKIYYFVMAKDSSRFGRVGEISIDFTSYAEATKLSPLSLPLKDANSAAVLHVLIQRVQGSLDPREINGSENASRHESSLRTFFGNGHLERSIRSNPSEDHGMGNGINKVRRAWSGDEVVRSSSGSSSGLDTPCEHEPKNTQLSRESSMTMDRSSQWDWLNGSAPKLSLDESSICTLGEPCEEGSSMQKLKSEVAELELQTLRKQIAKEMKRGKDLIMELAFVKKERDVFKEESEKLKGCLNQTDEVKVNGMYSTNEGGLSALLDELRQELNHERDLNSNLRLQLQKTQETDAESKSKSKSICSDDDEEQRELEAIVREHSGVKETCLLEQKIVDLNGEVELYKRDKDELEMQMEQIALDYEILKQENHDMFYKLERSQLEEQLNIQYECAENGTTSYTVINELETQIESLQNELKSKSKSTKELELHVKNLEEELENQVRGFEDDLEDLIRAKTEQEQRAIRAEDNLRKIRSQNTNAASRLQGELRRLSQKMASTFELNEKAAMEAMDECKELRVEKRILEDTIANIEQDLQHLGDHFQEKLVDLEDQLTVKSKHLEKMKKKVEDMTSELIHKRPNENFFLNREKDLQVEIQESERNLDGLVQKTENLQ